MGDGRLQQVAETLHALHQAVPSVNRCVPTLSLLRLRVALSTLTLSCQPIAVALAGGVTSARCAHRSTRAYAREAMPGPTCTASGPRFMPWNISTTVWRKKTSNSNSRPTGDRPLPRRPSALPRCSTRPFVREVRPSLSVRRNDQGRSDGFDRSVTAPCDVCRRTLDRVRLDIAAWTTTGMVRTGNEDAFAFLHGVDGRLDDIYEYAMVLLADGMGGYEAGEVAAAMALAEMKKYLLQQPMFAGLTGKAMPPGRKGRPGPGLQGGAEGRSETCQQGSIHVLAHAGQGQTDHGLHRRGGLRRLSQCHRRPCRR